MTSASRSHGGDSPVGGDKQEQKGMKMLPNECKGMTMVTRGHAVITGRSDMRSIRSHMVMQASMGSHGVM